ncbi:MAG: trypsin-like peptidase domain-containing protein [Deltaproteobacteria bacterium]|nr:trypsin-like peptidase domain-containing protein [Deltaproteobacteria bacterium]
MSQSAVVRIFATSQDPDHDCPWQARTPHNGTGSGVVIGDGQILTGAHVVANATFLQVQKISDPDKAIATVKGICHDCDLALLEVTSPGFMDGITAAEIGALPELRDRVSVVGFPVGGEEVSITEGVVSRIEVQRYSHSQRHILAVTVDAAINKGNSGGPVFSKDGKVTGIAFQKLSGVDNIGEMVPAPLIEHFLKAIEREPRARVPGLGITIEGLENPTLRSHIGLPEGRSGVLVLGVEYGNSAWGHLQPGDALLSIYGSNIANNATVQYAGKYRTRYDAILGERFAGDPITLEVLRDGKVVEVSFPLKPLELLVPRSQYDTLPSYYIYGGLVFQVLSRDFLSTWDSWWDKAPKEFLHHYYSGTRTEDKHEVVILTQILADEVNIGYGDLYSESVLEVNGTAPRSMKHFVDLVEQSKDLIEIKTSSKGRVVMVPAAAREANQSILSRYHIPRDRSANLAN